MTPIKQRPFAYCAALSINLLLASCSHTDNPCEEILEVKAQEKQCAQWQQIMRKDNYPQQALTARKNYEKACLNLRYHRDNYDTICKKGERPIGQPTKEAEK